MKKILSVMLAAMMGVSLMGCSGGSASTETQASSAGTEQASESSQETQAGSEGESMELKLATDAAEDYPTTMALISFADEVREKTNGRINIVVYPSSQLGDETAYMEQLTFGAVDIAKLSIGTISSLCKDLQVACAVQKGGLLQAVRYAGLKICLHDQHIVGGVDQGPDQHPHGIQEI